MRGLWLHILAAMTLGGLTLATPTPLHMVGRTDPRNQVTAYTNNWRGQPLTKTVGGTLQETFTYYATGWMKSAQVDSNNKSEFTCDAFGQVTSVTQTVDGVAKTVACQFYQSGERQQITYPTDVGVSLAYQYDGLGQTTGITRQIGSGDYATLATYTHAGRNLLSMGYIRAKASRTGMGRGRTFSRGTQRTITPSRTFLTFCLSCRRTSDLAGRLERNMFTASEQ